MDLRQLGRISIQTIGMLLLSLIFVGPSAAQEEKPAEGKPDVVQESAKSDFTKRNTAELLPATTRFWVSVEDLRRLETNLSNTQMGKLSRRDTLAPFFSSFEKQIRETLNNNGIKFGIDVASVEGMETGEVALAGVLPDFAPGEKPIPGSHGVVVLIDVSPDKEAAEVFLRDAAKKMEARGATQTNVKILDTEISKWTIEVKTAKIKRTQSSFVAIVDGWLFASDNESIFTNVLKRIRSKTKGGAADSLSKRQSFLKVKEKTRVHGVRPDFEWFVDPLGYARFADALAEEKADVRKPKDQPLEALAKEGLDTLEAVGGFVSFSTGEHDVLHRSLVYADREKAAAAVARRRILDMLDFAPKGTSIATPPKWAPVGASGYFTMTWDIEKAFGNVGPLFDAISEKEGTFDSVIEEMKTLPDYRVDLRKMVQSLGKRVTVVTRTEEPIDEASEKMLVGIELNDGVDEDWLIESIGRAFKGSKVKKLAGIKYVIDDNLKEEDIDDPNGLGDIGEIEIDDEDDEDEDEADEDEELPPRVTIFNRRFILIKDGVLFVCNDKDYLKKMISRKHTGKFAKGADFTQMNAVLAKLSDEANVRFRMFNRLDQMLKTNYEMMRTGRMAESETFIARMLNQVYGRKAGDKKRVQQINGADLPSDYDNEIAPSLGQSGWVMETTDSGWRFSGCVLPKAKAKAKVAEAPESPKTSDSSK